jgi:hypothetical protein
MKQLLLQYHKVIGRLAFVCLFVIMGTNSIYGQAPAPPEGNSSQYFCSANSWMNAGFTEPGDTFEELYLFGESLSFYENLSDIPSNPIANPSSYVLQDGDTYYVTQTVAGVESSPLTIDVTDRECGCLKNPDFETIDGQGTGQSYNFYSQNVDDGYKTCGGSIAGLTTVGLSPVNATANGSVATLVTPGQDPNTPLGRTNANNQFSEFALRLNDPASGLDTSHLEKEFVAGEVFSLSYAFALADPTHPETEQPYVNIAVYDENGNLFTNRCVISQPSDCILLDDTNNWLYSEWSCLKINTLDIIGQKAKIIVTVSDCVFQIHQGYVYLDDFFVGDNSDVLCDDPSFGYIAMESVKASEDSLDCVLDLEGTAQSCGASINASVPFPIEVCGTIREPVSNSNPASLQDLTLDISKNGNLVGTVSNPVINGNQFCFKVNESDINVQDAYGALFMSTEVSFTLDCGVPYTIEISDNANVDICPTAKCVAPLNTCDGTGTGIGTFDLTQADSQIRGSEWTANDVDITYYESELDAVDQMSAIATPDTYDNSTPYQQIIYARLDWHPQGTVTSCYYIIEIDLNVYNDPILDLPQTISSCGPGGISQPIVATPTNITDLQNVTYSWKRDGQLIPFSGSYYVASQGGTYEVTVSEENCSVTETVVVEYVEFEVDLGDNLVDLCGTADDYAITANIINDNSQPAIVLNDVTYLWSTGETSQSIDVSVSGTYSVDVTYRGCTETNMVDVNIGERPEVTLNGNQVICADETAQIVATVSNFNESEVEFTWYLDGGEITGEIQSSIDATQEGTYSVKVNQIGVSDCFNEDVSVDIEFYENAGCVLPQGLSPDTTPGQNDCFDLTFLNDRTGIDNLKIFNRYGRLVFEANNYSNSFCGMDQDGNELVTGTYFYVMDLKSEDVIFGKNKKGYIYINRQVN